MINIALNAALGEALDELYDYRAQGGEIRAELGSSYVCGGGYAHDVGSFISQFHPELAETDARIDRDIERIGYLFHATKPQWVRDIEKDAERAVVVTHDDIPF